MNTLAEYYQGDYLAPDDIGHEDDMTGKTVDVVIRAIVPPGTEKDASGKTIAEGMLEFEKAKKRFILNKTNYRILLWSFGRDESKWIGKTITLGLRWGDWFGEKNTPALRIIPPEGCPLPQGVRNQMGRIKP